MSTKNKAAGTQFTQKGVVQGVSIVDDSGNPYDSVVDGDGVRRLAVDANVTIGSATINVDLDAATDNVAIRNTSNSNELLINTDGSITTRLKDEAGNAFSVSNPLPIEIVNTLSNPNQFFAEASAEISLASYTTILTYTAISNGTNIKYAEITGGVTCTVRMTLNGTPIRIKRINSSCPNIEFLFTEPRTINNGDVITIECKPDKAVPAFMASSTFFASLQGFTD